MRFGLNCGFKINLSGNNAMQSSQKPTAQTVTAAIKGLREAERQGLTKRAEQIRKALKEAHQ